MKYKEMSRQGILAAVCVLAMSVNVFAEAVPADGQNYDKDGNIVIPFYEARVTLPAKWDGLFGFETESDDDKQMSFYHRASRDVETKEDSPAGKLFDIYCSKNDDFVEKLTNFTIIGAGEEGIYYITVPEDIQMPAEGDGILEEYRSMCEDAEWICEQASADMQGGESVQLYTTAVVNLREGNSTESEILDVISIGEEVEVTGKIQNAWMAVRCRGLQGYISAEYLSAEKPAAQVYTEPETEAYEEEMMQCPYCARWFSTLPDGGPGNPYDRHMAEERANDPSGGQTEQEIVQCPDCGNWYESGNIFRNHICAGRQ